MGVVLTEATAEVTVVVLAEAMVAALVETMVAALVETTVMVLVVFGDIQIVNRLDGVHHGQGL